MELLNEKVGTLGRNFTDKIKREVTKYRAKKDINFGH